MANLLSLFTLSLLTTMSLTIPAAGHFWKSVKNKPFKLGTAKLSRFQFYWHDIQSGSNPTTINIIKPPPRNTSSTTGFGIVNMIDDPLTDRPDNGSRMLGRAQGFYGLVSQEEYVLLMSMTFVFTTGRYSGSTLTVLGRNPVFQKVREMPVIGGTGLFRFARGYVHATTHTFNMQTRDAIVRYNVYVLHY
ncbi:putative dirigent protein [Helianthus annuus]|uniref:Dirigent protein n=1 Tax=Helianthus annuus TaxID=4232 RepID=A0A251VKB9_HELAN|nr:dirigent protein 22 [Helianthus annuus]KAF5819923.1 putative dirigent protein [Helianthus annuus]KAJ0606018.1 putative dirigent protein [Helianthus annuus]KAJ0616951.1 putative dirigent protein [Helianthus annuus]KAJ0620025.1 putative dirigent protein [Helianthus annuus]KAJ0778484.1 putative dirigent protein [Helianthus annuus]